MLWQKPSDKYIEPIDEEMGPLSEQKRWEEEHVKKGSMHFGARDAKKKHKASFGLFLLFIFESTSLC